MRDRENPPINSRSIFHPTRLAPFPVVSQLPRIPPILLGNLLQHDMRVLGLLPEDAHERISERMDQRGLLLTTGAGGDLDVDVRHRVLSLLSEIATPRIPHSINDLGPVHCLCCRARYLPQAVRGCNDPVKTCSGLALDQGRDTRGVGKGDSDPGFRSGQYGLANLPGYSGFPTPGPAFAPFAVAALVHSAADAPGQLIAPHEFAHVLGANHEPGPGQNPTPIQPYAFDHFGINATPGKPTLSMRDVMVFSAPPSCSGPCSIIKNYSNPRVSVSWFQTGLTNSRDNALLITETAPITAQYRDSGSRIFAEDFD